MARDRVKWLDDLSKAFKRHRGGRAGWFIEVHRDRLRVASTELPPRSGEPADEAPKRRTVTLRTPPGPATFKNALTECCAIYDAVEAASWQWPDPDAPTDVEAGRLAPRTLAKLRERLHEAVVDEKIGLNTWKRTYEPYLLKLEAAAKEQAWQDDTALLTATLRSWEPNSRSRQMAHDRMRAMWKVAGWPWPEAITAMRGNGKSAADPEGVRAFADEEITELRQRIERSRLTPADLVAWDCLIVFGLRPAELKGLELQQQGHTLVAVVSHEKKNSKRKVGARTVPVVPPAGWPADCHGLLERWQRHGLPAGMVAAQSPGQVLTQQLRRLRDQPTITMPISPELTAYGLRHAFALRLGIDLGLSVREAASLMGHSPAVHLQAYGTRLDQPKLLDKVAGLVAKR